MTHAVPFAGACTDLGDGRSQGTTAMFDSLPYRNDAATVLRRLIRSLPTRRGVSSTRCRTARDIIRRCRYSWPAEYLK